MSSISHVPISKKASVSQLSDNMNNSSLQIRSNSVRQQCINNSSLPNYNNNISNINSNGDAVTGRSKLLAASPSTDNFGVGCSKMNVAELVIKTENNISNQSINNGSLSKNSKKQLGIFNNNNSYASKNCLSENQIFNFNRKSTVNNSMKRGECDAETGHQQPSQDCRQQSKYLSSKSATGTSADRQVTNRVDGHRCDVATAVRTPKSSSLDARRSSTAASDDINLPRRTGSQPRHGSTHQNNVTPSVSSCGTRYQNNTRRQLSVVSDREHYQSYETMANYNNNNEQMLPMKPKKPLHHRRNYADLRNVFFNTIELSNTSEFSNTIECDLSHCTYSTCNVPPKRIQSHKSELPTQQCKLSPNNNSSNCEPFEKLSTSKISNLNNNNNNTHPSILHHTINTKHSSSTNISSFDISMASSKSESCATLTNFQAGAHSISTQNMNGYVRTPNNNVTNFHHNNNHISEQYCSLGPPNQCLRPMGPSPYSTALGPFATMPTRGSRSKLNRGSNCGTTSSRSRSSGRSRLVQCLSAPRNIDDDSQDSDDQYAVTTGEGQLHLQLLV